MRRHIYRRGDEEVEEESNGRGKGGDVDGMERGRGGRREKSGGRDEGE